MLNLIEDLLDTACIESGHVELSRRPCDLRQLVEGVAELVAPTAEEKGFQLDTYVSPDILDNVLVDPGRLRQVLLNLAGNVVKFTKTGGIGIEVTSSTMAPNEQGIELTFAIRDSGPGLSEKDQNRIFDEFV